MGGAPRCDADHQAPRFSERGRTSPSTSRATRDYEEIEDVGRVRAALEEEHGISSLALERRVVFLHGVPEDVQIPTSVASIAGASVHVTIPIACGELVERVHLNALLVSSHPRPVREAVERYRRELDADPVVYLERENDRRKQEVREAAAAYLGANASGIALTDSTTMGIALVYHGLRLSPGDEVLTTEHDYYATHESLRLASARSGARVRQVRLHERPETASTDEIVGNLVRGITPRTRALALTWVHSSTDLKLPIGGGGRGRAARDPRYGLSSEAASSCLAPLAPFSAAGTIHSLRSRRTARR